MASNVDLLAGEEVVFSTEKHWIAPLRDSWIPILMFLGAFVVAWISPDSDGFVGNSLDFVRTGLFVIGIAWIGYNIAVWRSATFAVTNRRVIGEEGLIGRRASATMLSSITDVQSRIPFVGNTLGYGDVLIMGSSGEAGSERLRSISRPKDFRDQVMVAIDALASARSGQGPAPAAPAPASAPPASGSTADAEQLQTLARLAELRDSGALTPEEFEAKKAEILARI
ncbi:MAG TPA: SHOCT domain-containing protein [Candidatus Limnocylindria bacterium]